MKDYEVSEKDRTLTLTREERIENEHTLKV